MPAEVEELECPGCGFPVAIGTTKCPKCQREITIRTFNDISAFSPMELNKQNRSYKKAFAGNQDNPDLNMSMAFVDLKLKLYDEAISHFQKAMEEEFDNPDLYFYGAVALLRGKKAFLAKRADIDKAEEYINAALTIEEKGIYYLLFAYIRSDFHKRKYLQASPDFQELLGMAASAGYSPADEAELFSLLNVDDPF